MVQASSRRELTSLIIVRVAVLVCAFALIVTPRGLSADKQVRFQVRLNSASENSDQIEVHGLSRAECAGLERAKLSLDDWRLILSVTTRSETDANLPPMLGEYHIGRGVLAFAPRFRLKPGLKYRVVFNPSQLPGRDSVSEKRISQDVLRPKPPPGPPTKIVKVYPSPDKLPENQLRFYIHFSAAMRRGEAYRHIHLLDQQGRRVEYPFLEFGKELWDNSQTRFTLYFDPGRVKRGLKPRELLGPVLERDKTYSLIIDGEWRDASDRPLAESFRKRFQVVSADYRQPNIKSWQMTVPDTGTRIPLRVTFAESLDHAMLEHVLYVVDSQKRELSGTVDIQANETRWLFYPDALWKPGQYELIADSTLEDPAGNSIGRAFEVDIFRPVEKQIKKKTVALPFRVEN